MNLPGTLKTLLGVLFWLGLIGWLVSIATSRRGSTTVSSEIAGYFFQDSIEFEVYFEHPVLLELGDGVYLDKGKQSVPPKDPPIGEVRSLLGADGNPLSQDKGTVQAARLRIFDRTAPSIRADSRARLLVIPENTMRWVWHMLFTEENLPLVMRELERSVKPHMDEVLERLKPVAEGLLADLQGTIATEGEPFFQRHRERIESLVRKVEEDLGEEKLTKLFEDEVWPIAEDKLEPVFDTLGKKIWEKFPLWGLTWRLAYQTLPFTADDHFERRWKLFIKNEVIPIIKSHAGDLLRASKEVARDTLTNPRVYATLHDALIRLLEDPDFHRLVWDFAEEVCIKNDRFHQRLKERWESRQTQQTFAWIAETIQLEATVRRIGDIVLGTKKSGITPEFARVLRAQILDKDSRSLVLDPGSSPLPLKPGAQIPGTRELDLP